MIGTQTAGSAIEGESLRLGRGDSKHAAAISAHPHLVVDQRQRHYWTSRGFKTSQIRKLVAGERSGFFLFCARADPQVAFAVAFECVHEEGDRLHLNFPHRTVCDLQNAAAECADEYAAVRDVDTRNREWTRMISIAAFERLIK